MDTSRRARLGVAGLVAVLAAAPACDRAERRRVTADGATSGQVALAFSGAFAGRAEGLAEVVCFEPADEGDRFTVEIDSQEGLPVAGADVRFLALDVAAAGYTAPGDYDLGHALAADDIDRGDYFLLFDKDPDPYEWGIDGSDGTLTVDEGTASGRVALRGWKNADGDVVDVSGTFTCGKSPEGDGG